MKAENLRLEELVDFSEGLLNFQGRRLVLHDLHAFAHFREDLLKMVGLEPARRILTRYGFFWGQADAAAMNRLFNWENIDEWVKAGPKLHELQGIAKTMIKSLEIDEENWHFNMELVWHNSGEAEEHLIGLGKTDHPVCWMLTGYASGYASFCMGCNIYFIEQKCRAKGDRVCTVVGKDLESWGKTIEPYLPYFESDDIKGKILDLTAELRRKEEEISNQRLMIDQLKRSVPDSMVEVHSAAFRRVLDLASRVAHFDSSVLLTGESGVGKEVMARHIHQLSHRKDGAFVAINCGALPESLLESELFGHRKGAFTGAIDDRSGLFEQANGGTIFLDEIGDITPAMQLKLLRVLQEREVLRVGENQPRKVNVRVISATNRSLDEAVAEGKFRGDLVYRLRVIEIEIPPLRDRRDDILPLARHFVKQMSKKLNLPNLRLDASCLNYLQDYSWPGNVRELENAIERAAVLSQDGVIRPEYLPPNIVHAELNASRHTDPSHKSLAQVERDHIQRVLKMTNGNQSRAARLLGIGTTTLWRKLKNLDESADDR